MSECPAIMNNAKHYSLEITDNPGMRVAPKSATRSYVAKTMGVSEMAARILNQCWSASPPKAVVCEIDGRIAEMRSLRAAFESAEHERYYSVADSRRKSEAKNGRLDRMERLLDMTDQQAREEDLARQRAFRRLSISIISGA